jgi:hypothetical protein
MKFRLFALFTALLSAVILVACGGGSTTTTTTPTPVTTAPVAATSSNQLASSVSVSSYSALSIASKSSSTVQTAGIKGLFQNLLARIISPAYAAACTTDAYKLVGVNADGSSTPISVTQGTDQCGVGFRSMFDAGKYILLTGDSIYKDDLTCNLVFLNKTSGELFCVGETVPAKYDILGQTAWKNYPRLQVSDDKNYLFLEAASVIFDSNNQITGKKTKLMRFDLSDDTKGPQATILVEGFQNSWLNQSGSGFTGDASQFEGFEIQNYAGLNNGDAMVMYNRFVYSTGTSMSTSALSKLNNFYYRFEADSNYTRIEVDVDKAGTLVRQEISANTGSTATFAPGNIYQIPCYFRSTTNKDKFFFAIPYYYWDGTRSYNKSLIVSAVRPAASATKLDLSRYTSTAMCGNSWNQTASYQVINGVYYSLATNWVYDPNTGSGSQVTALTKKDMGFATETPLADVVYTISSDTSWGGSKQIFVSKDYLYIKAPAASGTWTGASSPGDSLERYDPANFTIFAAVGSMLGTPLPILSSADNISVQSISSSATDNTLKVVGRRTDDPDLVKVYGDISAAGLLAWASQKATTYSPVTIVKL